MYLWDCLTNDDIHWYVEMEVLDTVDYALITGEKYIDACTGLMLVVLFWKQRGAKLKRLILIISIKLFCIWVLEF